MSTSTKVPANFRFVGPSAGLLPAAKAAASAPRIPLTGRLTPEQVAEHNAFIDAMRDDDTFGHLDQRSRFVGVTRGLDPNTTI